MGYDGRASLYISRIRDAAWEREGLNLEFYRGYNVTWHDPAKYLDALNSLNMFSSDMRLSVEPTGDWNGVHVVNETVLGRCFDRYFWYPPICRHDPSTCCIYITGGNGWTLRCKKPQRGT
ncbi:unnamed protein product [Durusdinium trenchii]|uniref:Uncharacterized protein n=1 Tax=Durusdinium trenchii TaxID=1381693 RepID=A0ABP0JCE9_9DINO